MMSRTATRGARSRCDHLGRVAAVLTFGSACLHGLALPQHASAAPVFALLIAGMAVACLACAKHLWCQPSVRVFGLSATMNAFMVMAHLTMMQSPMMHHHGGATMSTAAPMANSMAGWNLMTGALALAMVELLFAAAVVFFRTRSMPAIIGASARALRPSGEQSPARCAVLGAP